jgi:hypothetical protein
MPATAAIVITLERAGTGGGVCGSSSTDNRPRGLSFGSKSSRPMPSRLPLPRVR